MKNTKSLLKFCLAAFCTVTAVSCSDAFMDEINKDENHPKDVNAMFMIPELELRTAQNVTGGDFNTYLGSYVEYWVGTFNQLYNAETRTSEIYKSSTFNNVWESVYENIRNAKIIINKCTNPGPDEGDKMALGVAQILLAYNAAFATDMFGDTPYTEVGDVNKYPNPKADKQEDIYTDVFKLLEEAKDNLAGARNTLNSYDFLFGGNSDKWIAFANGLEARYTMRKIYRSDNKKADYEQIVKYCDSSFPDRSFEASFNPGYDDNNMNPLFDFQYSREYIASSQSLYDKLMAEKNPMAERAYVWPWDEGMTAEDAKDNVAPNGDPEQGQENYAWDAFSFCCYSPVLLQSYHEVQFIKAEALARLGNKEKAGEALKEAVIAAMVNAEEGFACYEATMEWEGCLKGEPVTEEIAEAYFDEVVGPAFNAATDPVKFVMLQKYIALWNANCEACETYNDVRRLKALGEADVYAFQNPKADKFPLRCPYGSDDTVNNPNIQKLYGNGQYVLTENVWWAGGSR